MMRAMSLRKWLPIAGLVATAVLASSACKHVVWQRPLKIGPEPPLEGEAPRFEDRPWLEIEAPEAPCEVESVVPLVEIAGRLHRTPRGGHDVVIAIDTSGSAFWASGEDIDGDGVVGVSEPLPRGLYGFPYGAKTPSSDPGDRVLEAERIAAMSLLDLLDPAYTRAALVKFGTTPWVETFLGPPGKTRRSVENFRYRMRGGTDIYRAIERAVQLFEDESAPGRTRSILLLSDGQMSLQISKDNLENYRRRVVRGARAVRARVFAFGVGPLPMEKPELLEGLAHDTGGAYIAVGAASDIRVELPMINLAGLSDIEIINHTTGESARAVRVFPDGSFDGYAPLRPGANELTIRAALTDGDALERTLAVRYERPEEVTEAGAAEGRELLELMRDRTAETDLARRAQTVRRARRLRALEIEVERAEP